MTPLDQFYAELMNIIGIQGSASGRIIDADTMNPIILNGGYLIDPSVCQMVHRLDVLFDPINNPKLMKYLFNVFVSKEAEDNNLIINSLGSSPYPVKVAGKPLRFQVVLNANTGTYVSDFYYKEALQYVDILYKLSGYPMRFNLRELDNTEEQQLAILNSKSRRK